MWEDIKRFLADCDWLWSQNQVESVGLSIDNTDRGHPSRYDEVNCLGNRDGSGHLRDVGTRLTYEIGLSYE